MTDANPSLRRADKVELTIDSDTQWLKAVREQTASVATAIGFDQKAVGGIVLAVDEALANVIRHAYRNEAGHPIEVSLSPAQKDGRTGMEIIVRDYGQPVDPSAIYGRDLQDVQPGGLGVHIILSVMESAEYARAEGGGTRLRMLKFLSSDPETEP